MGGLRQRLGDAALRRLSGMLARGDFKKHVLETAKHYKELSSVRLLTRGAFRNWTKMYSSGSFVDHLVPSYIGCLRDATYPGAGPASVFDETGARVVWSKK